MSNSRKSKMTVPLTVRRGLLILMDMGCIMDSPHGYESNAEEKHVNSAIKWLERLTDKQKQEDKEQKYK